MRKVFIGTPCYDGKIDVWYANSLIQTERIAREQNIEIIPIYMSYDSLVQRARNDCVHLALEMGCDDIVWIDADIEWRPEWFFQLLNYDVDIVGGTYRKKSDNSESYVVSIKNELLPDKQGLMSVSGLGCGFTRFSKKAIQYLWNNSEPYTENGEPESKRMIFDVRVKNGELISEDIVVCDKLKQGGFDIWLDPHMTCNHTGIKKFQGNFKNWYSSLRNNVEF